MDRINYGNHQQPYIKGQNAGKNNHNPQRKNGFAKMSALPLKSTKVTDIFDNRLKIFIKNIPNDDEAIKSKVRQLLEPCGEIIHERYFSRRRGPNTIHSALIVFKSPTAVKKALELHGSIVEDRRVIVSSHAQYSANVNGVHVKNLSWDTTEEDLWDLFEAAGKILFINISNPVNLNASNDLLEGEIIFETEEEVKEALLFDNAEIRGVPVVISRISRESKASQAHLAVHVSGLPQDVTKEKVIQFFDKCGAVRMVKVNFKFLTAVVHFASEEGVKAARQLDGRSLDNNRLSVRQREGEILNLDLENPVYIYNIPESVRDVDIFIAFQKCGYIIEVRFIRRKTASLTKRAVIQFKYPESVAEALALDGVVLGGERVSVSTSEKCFSSEGSRHDETANSSNSKSKNKKRNPKSPQMSHHNAKRSRPS